MKADANSYKQILKATTLFGSVQFISIISSVFKTKIAALFIGPVGVGIFAVLSSTLSFIEVLTRCGLDLTIVKEIASSEKSNIPKKIQLSSQLALITGIIGVIIVLISSPWLSLLAFKNKAYTLFFITVSIAVLFNQLYVNNIAVLQGLKALKKLAKVITYSSILSLLPTISIYYFFGQKGIPWVIVITAIISFFVSKYFMTKVSIQKHGNINLNGLFVEGKNILKSGLYLSLANIITISVGFILQILILNLGGIEEAGLYNAGFILINSYVTVFFSALSKDFFPRLVEISNDKNLVNKTVNEQAYMLLLLLTPIIITFIIFKPLIVSLFFSKDFIYILGMINFGILATAFKAISWSMGFILIAKGDSKLYFVTEIVSNTALLISIFIGYKINGLTGVGVSFLIYHILDLVFIKLIVTKRYKFYFNESIKNLLYISTSIFIVMASMYFVENKIIKYLIMLLMFLFSIIFTFIKLNNHIKIKEYLLNKFKK